MTELTIQFVRGDGTYDVDGVRVRCAPGSGVEGSLQHEFERGVCTPIVEHNRDELLEGAGRVLGMRDFVASLPVARMVPVPDPVPEDDPLN